MLYDQSCGDTFELPFSRASSDRQYVFQAHGITAGPDSLINREPDDGDNAVSNRELAAGQYTTISLAFGSPLDPGACHGLGCSPGRVTGNKILAMRLDLGW